MNLSRWPKRTILIKNLIEFHPGDSVVVSPLICQRSTIEELDRNILVFYTGVTRNASDLLQNQAREVNQNKSKRDTMNRMVELAFTLRDELQRNNVSVFGEVLHENWMLKWSLTMGISNHLIDKWYDAAIKACAIGGKILSAGAGAF